MLTDSAVPTNTAKIPTLRSTRERLGLSVRGVARLVGTDPTHLSRLERGLDEPSFALLRRLASCYGMDAGYLVALYLGTERGYSEETEVATASH